MKFCVVGAGFTGAVLSRHLAERGHLISLIDERSHIAGNCHTVRDERSNVLIHRYGPHIFHTADERCWEYIRRFGSFRPYVNRVKAIARGSVYSLPINLHTINQLFGRTFSPHEARRFITEQTEAGRNQPSNFEEQALATVGRDLYETFFFGYTRKQWGVQPRELPASILKRLPIRFTYDDNYFHHPYQAVPTEGYSAIVSSMLQHDRINLELNRQFETLHMDFDHVFYSGAIDRFFDYRLGRLGYRTLDFERIDAVGDYQGAAVINYCDNDVPYTRITEHRHFAPWDPPHDDRTVCFREYSRSAGPTDIPYYPIRLAHERTLLDAYLRLASQEPHVSFLGRLGTYRYLDMDVTISQALEACDQIDACLASGAPLPAFFHDPSQD